MSHELNLQKKSLGILGAGAFGTSLAFVYCNKFDVSLFSCFKDHVDSMNQTRTNEFFKDFIIPDNVKISLTDDLDEYDYLLWCFPIKPTPNILRNLKNKINGASLTICSKGFLHDSTFVYALFKRELSESKITYLSGPNFANELAGNKISAADIAAENIDDAKRFANDLTTENFKLNPTDDLIGSQICGAMKNVIAIACGISYGLKLGQNFHAILVTKALDEMKNLGTKLGAKAETFYGLCGLGDLILTTSSTNSRNTSLGFDIANAKPIEEILKETTCEGYDTLPQIIELSKKNNLHLPICEAVYQILFEGKNPSTLLDVCKENF